METQNEHLQEFKFSTGVKTLHSHPAGSNLQSV